MEKGAPIRPVPKPFRLSPKSSAVAVLDLSVRCNDPSDVCYELMPKLGEFLERARGAGVPIIFTVSRMFKGTPEAQVARALNRRESEPVICPDAHDKFMSGELYAFLAERGVRDLVFSGSQTNICILYTATTAARIHHYNAIVPLDGVNAHNDYENEYALHQLSVLPPEVNTPVQFTNFSMIEFQ